MVERATGDDLAAAVQRLLYSFEHGNRTPWSLLAGDERTRKLVGALRDSTNAAWRAAAVWVLARRDSEKNTEAFEQALKDANVWVRAAAVQGLARSTSDRAALETRLTPFLGDTNSRTADVAALALLEPELRTASGLHWSISNFQFEEIQASASESVTVNEDRPLTVLESKPKYLETAREHLLTTNGAVRVIFALLLAQHGQFEGIDRLLARQSDREVSKTGTLPEALLAGIALSRDTKYIPYLRRLMDRTQQDWDLRKILRALKGMSGPEARQLRVDVNKRMRTASAGMSVRYE